MQKDDRSAPLTGVERGLLAIPALAGAFFGLFPLLASTTFAAITGFPGNDPYMYWLAGAATLGYFAALTSGITGGDWLAVRWVVLATLVFNLASLYACVSEIAGGAQQIIVYLITVTSIFLVALTGWLLYRHRGLASAAPDIALWVIGLTGIATLLAALFGLLPLLIPVTFGHLFGYQATDVFLYRQAGAATLGYAAMGIFELRARMWREMRLPAVMGAVFNGVSCLASIVAILKGDRSLLVLLVAPVSLLVTIASVAAIQREGK